MRLYTIEFSIRRKKYDTNITNQQWWPRQDNLGSFFIVVRESPSSHWWSMASVKGVLLPHQSPQDALIENGIVVVVKFLGTLVVGRWRKEHS
jgi:hypothetical protein